MTKSKRPSRLLIIDDEALHLKALCETLTARGYTTSGFTSARAALAALRKDPNFDLILTDLMMPEMDGIALLKSALEIDRLLVCVIMTGHGTIDTAVNAMKQGAIDYIAKPFKMSTLLPVISRALDAREMRIENERLQQSLRARTLELEAANKELETFSYSVSHDLRAPLRAINGYMQLLVEGLAERLDGENRTYADQVSNSVVRMQSLIDDLLRLARTARTELHRQPLDLSAITDAIAQKLQAETPERKAEWLIAPGLTADADPGLIQVALDNLLANAWKYTSRLDHARIEFGIERQPDGSSAYYVRDNGAGFDMKYAHRLFAPFQRLHSERDFAGTGVGLATVQRIIHKHGGRIWPQATPNQGATFYFTVPPAIEP